jgi:hypothetical protein
MSTEQPTDPTSTKRPFNEDEMSMETPVPSVNSPGSKKPKPLQPLNENVRPSGLFLTIHSIDDLQATRIFAVPFEQISLNNVKLLNDYIEANNTVEHIAYKYCLIDEKWWGDSINPNSSDSQITSSAPVPNIISKRLKEREEKQDVEEEDSWDEHLDKQRAKLRDITIENFDEFKFNNIDVGVDEIDNTRWDLLVSLEEKWKDYKVEFTIGCWTFPPGYMLVTFFE